MQLTLDCNTFEITRKPPPTTTTFRSHIGVEVFHTRRPIDTNNEPGQRRAHSVMHSTQPNQRANAEDDNVWLWLRRHLGKLFHASPVERHCYCCWESASDFWELSEWGYSRRVEEVKGAEQCWYHLVIPQSGQRSENIYCLVPFRLSRLPYVPQYTPGFYMIGSNPQQREWPTWAVGVGGQSDNELLAYCDGSNLLHRRHVPLADKWIPKRATLPP